MTTNTKISQRSRDPRVMRITANVLTVTIAAMMIWVAYSYLFDPLATAPGFGLPAWPSAEAAGFLNVKGIRDLGTVLVPLVLLLTGQRRALGWALVATSVIPFGDAAIILAHGGSVTMALFVHALTAVIVLVTGLLHLRVSVISQDRSVGSTA